MTLTLLHLFPKDLGASGDSGNVQVVSHRLSASGIDNEIIGWSGSSELPQNPAAVFIGNGPWSAASLALQRLEASRDALVGFFDQGIPFFAVGVGAELLGREITLPDGQVVSGLGIFPMTVQREADRRVGYMRVSSADGDVIGFGDFASLWHIDDGEQPLGNAVVGDRVNQIFSEGLVSRGSIATRLGGPALPLNPMLTNRFIAGLAQNSGFSFNANPLPVDDYANHARALIVNNLNSVFTTIAL